MVNEYSISVPFDDGPGGKYEILVINDPDPDGDEVQLHADTEALRSLARVFEQLANVGPGAHVHLGLDESELGPGFTVVVSRTGRHK